VLLKFCQDFPFANNDTNYEVTVAADNYRPTRIPGYHDGGTAFHSQCVRISLSHQSMYKNLCIPNFGSLKMYLQNVLCTYLALKSSTKQSKTYILTI
jgi:hypothetical protein